MNKIQIFTILINIIETTLDSCRNFKSKELKDSKSTQAHTGKILSLFKLEKYYAASCSEDKQIKVWNWRTGKLKKIFKTDRPCKAVFGVNELLIGVEGNMMIVIDWKSKKVENISTHTNEINIVCPVKSKMDKIQRIILIDNQDGIYLYKFDVKSKSFQFEKELMKWNISNDQINQCLVYSDQQIIFSTARSGHLCILNWITGKEERRFDVNQPFSINDESQQQNGIQYMMIHPQRNSYIFISCKNGQFGVWDADNGVIALKISRFFNPIQIMCKQSYNQIVISDGKDYQLLTIQQYLSFSFKKCSSYHFSEINSLLYLDDEFFLTSDVSGRLRIWQLEQPYILPDGSIGTLSNPIFNILQCPELNSLNNSLSSASGFSQQQHQQNGQSFYSSQNEYNSINNNDYNNQQSKPQHNIYHQTDYTYEDETQRGEEFINQDQNNNINNSQNSQQQNQYDEKDQTFQNSKFVNDSLIQENNQEGQIINNQQDILPQLQQSQSHRVRRNDDDYEFFEHSPQFNPGSADDLNNDKYRQQSTPTKVKILNLEEVFNIKRKELEQQQLKSLNGSLQPISSLYSKFPQQQSLQQQQQKMFGSEDQQIEVRLTIPQSQLIQSDRSFQSEFSLCNHKNQVSKINDDEKLQPDQEVYNQQVGQNIDSQKTMNLIINLNDSKDNQQALQNTESLDKDSNNFQNYNSIVSNASEQYLTQIHSHLNYPLDEICSLQQSVQEQQLDFVKKSTDINHPTQLSSIINAVNQKLIQMNQETQLQQSLKCQQIQQSNLQTTQKSISMISQEEANQLRMELENLRIKINDYKRLNDSLDVNYQIITKKFTLELEKNEIEKIQKIEMTSELQNLKEQIELLQKQKSQLQENVNEIDQKYSFEVQQREKLFVDLQNLKNQNEQKGKADQILQNDLQNKLKNLEQMYSSEVKIKEQMKKENEILNRQYEDLNNQVKIFKNEKENLMDNNQNITQENKKLNQQNQDLSNEIQKLQAEKQNLINQNEEIMVNNENLSQELSFLTKEKLNLNNELEEHYLQLIDLKKQIQEYQNINSQYELKLSTIQSEFQSYKLQMESSKLQQLNDREEFILKINQIIFESASEKNLIDFYESIQKVGLSVKELEVIQNNIYEKQLKILQSQIEEQNKENLKIQKSLYTIEAKNQNFMKDIEQLNKENDRIKQESCQNKNSLDHYLKQYNILLDRENLQQKNIEQKEELILLLKQEIEKLNSLYQQQLQEQLNQNAQQSKNTIVEQCRKELLLDEWTSLLSLIDNDSIQQFSRIEQTNRKSEIPTFTMIPNQNNQQNSPLFDQTNLTPQQQNKQLIQNLDLKNYQKLNNDKNEQLTPKQININKQTALISQIPQIIQQENKYDQELQNAKNSNSQLSQPQNKAHKLLQGTLTIQNQVQPNKITLSNQHQLNSNKISLSPSQLAKSQLEQNFLSKQQGNEKTIQIQQADKNIKQYLETNQQHLNIKSYNINVDDNSDKSNLAPISPNQTNIHPICHQQNGNPSTPTSNTIYNQYIKNNSPYVNSDQKINNQISQQVSTNTVQNKNNFFSNEHSQSIKGVQTNQPYVKSLQSNNLPYFASQGNNVNAQMASKTDRNLQEIQNINKLISQEIKSPINTALTKDLKQTDKEHRSKSPQSVLRSNLTLTHTQSTNQINQQLYILQPIINNSNDNNSSNNINSNNTTSNSTNKVNNLNTNENKIQKSERSISGLQNLRNIKKNISLTNVSSFPITTLNVNTLSPNSYNDKPSEFIRRQIEHQQFIQNNDKKIQENLNQRSLTPQPQKQIIGSLAPQPQKIISGSLTPQYQKFSQGPLTPQTQKIVIGNQITSIQPQDKILQEKLQLSDNQSQEKLIKNNTIDQLINKQKLQQISIQIQNQLSLSPNRTPSIHITTGNLAQLQPTQVVPPKQISLTPTSQIDKRQKIQEALKMTYLNKDEQNNNSTNIIKQNLDVNSSHNRCKTEDPNCLFINDLQAEQYKPSRNYQQIQAITNFYETRLSPSTNKREQKQIVTPTNLQKLALCMNNNPSNQLNIKVDQNTVLNKIVSTTNQTRSFDFNQKQQNQFADINQTPMSISPSMTSLQKNSNLQQGFLNNKGNLNSTSSHNIIQKNIPKQNEQEHKLNFEYASQNGNINQQNQFNQSPHAQNNFFSQKKSNTEIERFGNKIDIIQGNQTPNNHLQNYHNNNLNNHNSNSKTNFQLVSDEKNLIQNVNNMNGVKKSLYRNYSINSTSNQNNL